MKNLKELRKEAKLSQRELALIFSVTQQAICKYENGLSEPGLQTLIKMADFFNTSIDYLVGRTDNATNVECAPTNQELYHLNMYRKLSASDRNHINGIIQSLALDQTKQQADKKPHTKSAPGRKRKSLTSKQDKI